MVLQFIVLVAVVFVGISLALYLLQTRMIFFPQPTAPINQSRYAAHAIHVQNGDVTLSGWFFNNGIDAAHPLIIYYGGNAEDVTLNFDDLDRFATRSFLFMNYRGYGASQGRPSETALLDDALVIMDHVLAGAVVDPAHVVLMGRSLGSGVAVHVAAHRPVGGLILVTPYDSLVNVAKAHYPVFPVGWLLKHRFDSASLAPRIHAPALFLTAVNDQVVPPRFPKALERQWGGPTTAVAVAGADHNSIDTAPAYWAAVNAFLATYHSR